MKARFSRKEATEWLVSAELEPTEHRLDVLVAVGRASRPSSAPEILATVRSKKNINRVTVYRILDLLVEHGVLNRLDLGEKSQRFCLRNAEHSTEHTHFYCIRCKRYLCLPALPLDHSALCGLEIRQVDIRLTGICPECGECSAKST